MGFTPGYRTSLTRLTVSGRMSSTSPHFGTDPNHSLLKRRLGRSGSPRFLTNVTKSRFHAQPSVPESLLRQV